MPLIARLLESAATLLGPSVKTGDFVEWKASRGTGRGKVASLHTRSHVPGVPVRVEGSDQKPAARIQVYVRSAGGWVPSGVHVGMPVDKLAPIEALAEPVAQATEGVVAGSFDAIRQAVAEAVKSRIEETTGLEPYVWVRDLGPDWAVYELSGCEMWMIAYTANADGTVTLDPAGPTEVYEVTAYQPVVEEPTLPTPVAPTQVMDPVAEEPAGAAPAADGGDGADMAMAEGVAQTDTLYGRLLASKGADAAGGRVFRVEIVRVGDSKNGRRYTEAVLRAAAPMYEGAKAFDHHRTDAELATSTLAGLVGTYRNVEATSAAIEGDLVLLPSATHVAEALDQSLANQGAGLEPLVGISHDVQARYRFVEGAGGRRIIEATQIVAVNSADVVAHPSAGGRATRMVASHNPTQHDPEGGPVKFKQLLALLRTADVAKRDELLAEHAQILEAADVSRDEAIRMAEAMPVDAPAAVTTLAKTSILTRTVATQAVAAAGLPEKLVESVLAEMPDTFTEAQLTAKVEGYRRLAEGFERASLTPSVVAVTKDERDKRVSALDAMFANNLREGYTSLRQAYSDIMGVPARFDADFAREIMAASINVRTREGYAGFDSGRTTESLDLTSWAQIMGDSITRRMVAEYNRPGLTQWEGVVATVGPAINDFRTQRVTRMGGYGVLSSVAEAGPYQNLTSPGDEEATYAVSKRGGIEDMTLEMVANDDLRSIQRIPTKLGVAAAQTLNRFVWNDCFIANPTCTYDSVALFHSSHSNTTSTALSSAALNTSRAAMRKQAGYGDSYDVLSITPKTLITVPTLEHLAWQLVTSAVASPSGAPAGAASNIPNLHQGMQLVILDWYDATSSTFWAIAADPGQVPMIEIGFFNGRRDPELFTQADPNAGSAFSADKVSYKIRHIYGGTVIDHRGLSRGNS